MTSQHSTASEQTANIALQLKEIFSETLQKTELPSGPIQDVLDSVDRLALMVAVEDHYEIMFDPEEEEKIETVEDFVSLIQMKLREIQ